MKDVQMAMSRVFVKVGHLVGRMDAYLAAWKVATRVKMMAKYLAGMKVVSKDETMDALLAAVMAACLGK